MSRQVVKLGDVLAIALPDGHFAFGRMFKEGVLGIYAKLGMSEMDIPIGYRIFAFQVGVYKEVISSGKWPKVGKDLFICQEDDWPVPRFAGRLDEKFVDIYERGYSEKKATPADVIGWECVAAWDAQHIIDRILAAALNVKSKWDLTPWQVDFIDLSEPGQYKRIPPITF